MERRCKLVTCDISPTEDKKPRTYRFVGVTENPNRMGDVVEVAGWDFSNYMKNPVLLWAHDSRQPPIGRAINVQQDLENKRLVFDIEFIDGTTSPFAEMIEQMVKGGFVNAVSVGFNPIEFEVMEGHEDDWWPPIRFKKQELLELSVCNVPMDADALRMLNSAQEGTQQYAARQELMRRLKDESSEVSIKNALDVITSGPAALKDAIVDLSKQVSLAFQQNAKAIGNLTEVVRGLTHLAEIANADPVPLGKPEGDIPEDSLQQFRQHAESLKSLVNTSIGAKA